MSKRKLRDNPAAIAEYLTDMFEKSDLAYILDAIKLVVQAQNVTALAEVANMRRDGLYRSFDGETDPKLSRILSLFDGLHVRIVVKPLPAGAGPPRPKPGRPLKRTLR